MMNNTRLLYIAAFFTLFTFVGHSVGTLIPQTPANETLAQAQMMMDLTVVEMPFGPAKSLGQMAYGGNAFISLYLLVSGLMFILLAKKQNVKSILVLNSVGLVGCAILSWVYFFPIPAICTTISAILGLVATRKS